MVTRLLRSLQKNVLPLTANLFAKLTLSAHFSSLCRNKHFPNFSPPAAKKLPFTATTHGITWEDPYRWMSNNVNDPDFIKYLQLENSYAGEFMRDTEEMQKTLYAEMVSRMPSDISTPPERWGRWLYYQCIPEGKEYPVFCRKLADERTSWVEDVIKCFKGGFEEQVLLDWNEIAEKYGYVHVGTCRVSPDHNFLAYTVDTNGNEQFCLRIKDLISNSILPQVQVESVVSLAWAEDSRTLFYTLCDQNQRPYRVSCTKLESHCAEDTVVFTENDSCFCLDIASTKDGKFVTVNSNSRTSSEVYVINTKHPQAELQKFCNRVSGIQYFLEHHSGFFYVLTNAPTIKSKNFSGNGYYLARCRDEDVRSDHLQNVIMPGEDTCLEDMDICNGHLVLYLNRKGSPSICSIDMPIHLDCEKPLELSDLNPWFFPLPSNMCTVTPGSNHDFITTVYRAVLSSPVMPDLLVDYDMSRKTFSIVQQDVTNISTNTVLNISYANDTNMRDDEAHGWKEFSEKYACEEKVVVSHDGVSVPLTILFSRSAYQEGQSPGLLHGYGAYGEALDRTWCSDRLSLLDRGWLIAFADVRGGAGSDPCWHKSGIGLHKLNSIQDFIASGEYLVNKGFIHKHKLCAMGISAGGLLVGAAINSQPKLFCAAILKVPFLDVLNSLLDPNLPLTTLDYEEFGNPQIQSYFDYIRKYSPYENVPQGVCCPSMLVSASFNDSRVGVWEAAKWVAKIRDTACPNCSSAVILQTDMMGGHFRDSGRFTSCRDAAYDYSFLIKALGI